MWIFFSLSTEDVTWVVEFWGAIAGYWCMLVHRRDFCTLCALSSLYLGPQFRSDFCTLYALIFPSLWCSLKPFQLVLAFILPFFHQLKDGQFNSSHVFFFFIWSQKCIEFPETPRYYSGARFYSAFIRGFKKQAGFKETGRTNLKTSICSKITQC